MESVPLKIIPETDEQLTEVLKASIQHEKEKRKINRPSWKTEHKKQSTLNKKLTIQRNAAIWFLAGYILTDILFKIFS